MATRPLIDALTGVYRRDALRDRAEAALQCARSRGSAVALLLVDLDYFKSVNDAFGHSRGDQALAELGSRLRTAVRRGDEAFRYGGDEFVVVCPGASRASAGALAQRLLEGMRAEAFPGDPPIHLTLSIGWAVFPEDGADYEGLFQTADRRLMDAKCGGRNRCAGSDLSEGLLPEQRGPGRLIEREAVLREFRDFVSNLSELDRGVFHISGHAGSGRTAVLTEAVREALLRGFPVALLQPGAPGTVAEPPRIRMSVGNEWRLLSSGVEELRQQLSLLEWDTGQRLLLAIDDWERVHPATAREFQDLVRHATGALAGVLVTGNLTAPRRSLAGWAGPVREVILEPLSREGLRAWLRSHLRREPPAPLLEQLYQETEGLPRRFAARLSELEPAPDPVGTHHDAMPGGTSRSLPSALTRLVGREAEVEHVVGLIESERLVTLVGACGIGKTRLALAAARRAADGGREVVFVPLASVRNADRVLPVIGHALGAPETADGSQRQSIAAAIRGETLLVLDNFEQVADAGSEIGALLATVPQLRALITSRTALRVYGEALYQVPPLPVPDGNQLHAPESSPSVVLFCERAQAAWPEFRVTPENAPALAEVCIRLDGLPLAIELAAAQARILSPEKMLERLASRLTFLSGGPVDLSSRQRTLRGALDWSYELLEPGVRRFFARMGVFVGGCTLEGARACGEEGTGADAVECVSRLLDHNLLRLLPAADSEPRFGMLEVVREYALERLAEAGETEWVRILHSDYFTALAETAAPELTRSDQASWLDRLEAEHANLLAVLQRSHAEADGERLLRVSGALWRFWLMRGHYTEGRQWLQRALELRGSTAPACAELGRALYGGGVLAMCQAEYHRSQELLWECLRVYRTIGDLAGMGSALNNLGSVTHYLGDDSAARRFYEESLSVRRELDDDWGMAASLNNLGTLLQGGGDLAAAEATYTESLTIARRAGDRNGAGVALHNLAEIALLTGRRRRMRELQREALAVRRELGDRAGLAALLDQIAQGAAETGGVDRALRLCGAAEALREQIRAPLPPGYQAISLVLGIARTRLDESRLQALWFEGRAMGFPAAVDYAMGDSEAAPASG